MLSDLTAVSDTLELLAGMAVSGTLIFLVRRQRRTRRTFVADFERGVRFVAGRFVDVLGPGVYRCDPANTLVNVVDMRPQPILIERMTCEDALHCPVVMSIGAEMLVEDPFIAMTKLQHRINDTLALVRGTVRASVARRIVDASTDDRSGAAGEIASDVNTALRGVGMRVERLEITELWSRPVAWSPAERIN